MQSVDSCCDQSGDAEVVVESVQKFSKPTTQVIDFFPSLCETPELLCG